MAILEPGPGHDDGTNALLPIARRRVGELEFAEQAQRDGVQEVVLALEVVVERHPLDAQLRAEAAHGQCLRSLGVDQLERGLDDTLAREPVALSGASHSRLYAVNFT